MEILASMRHLSDVVHERSLSDPDGFWAKAAEAIDWFTKWDRVCDRSRAPFYRWFTGATVNTCYNALDRHVAGPRASQPALIYDSPLTGTIRVFTYRELLDQVSVFAGALAPVAHLEYFHDHARIEQMLFDGVVVPMDGALRPDLSRPGLGLELKRADAERYAV